MDYSVIMDHGQDVLLSLTLIVWFMVFVYLQNKTHQYLHRPAYQKLLTGGALLSVLASLTSVIPGFPGWIDQMRGVLFALALALGTLGLLGWAQGTIDLINRLTSEATIDPLTGLYNRGKIYDLLEKMIKGRDAFTLVLADLDGLKTLNDSYGHLMGDEFLLQSAKILKDAFPGSHLGRIGGDEFLALIPSSPKKESFIATFSSIKSSIKELGLPIQSGISLGFAHFPSDGLDPYQLIKIADQRMYLDKTQIKKRAGSTDPTPARNKRKP
ncbi:MAG: GGDEF domain-containing protein [Firmicutes bacterium]|nr:GGDEF domain-containing protein [Bacillota bacterium]